MPRILEVFERKDVLSYLEARGLVKQYIKARQHLLRGNFLSIFLKERKPKNLGIWQFRINKQFRALGTLDDAGILTVNEIDNHQ